MELDFIRPAPFFFQDAAYLTVTYILNPIHAKVYVIDDGDHSTMLLAEEY